MRRYQHLVDGVMLPSEIENLQRIFDEITAQSWFELNDFTREAFASELIKLHRRQALRSELIFKTATLIAQAHFSRGVPDEKRRALDLLHGEHSD